MSWSNFYLVCFLVGLFWSLASLLLGHLHLSFHAQPAHGDLMHGAGGHAGLDSHGAADAAGHYHHGTGDRFSFINFGTLAAFLSWFGGMGYLLTEYSTLWFFWGLGLALLTGLAGATALFLFVSKVLMAQPEEMSPSDYEMVGVLGRICSPIREGGTGELIFTRDGSRQTCGARSEEGKAIAKGKEVVVTRYENGLAYVRPWDELAEMPMSGCQDEPNN
jgi:membrane protein implicated in regulation of membrane protease activity